MSSRLQAARSNERYPPQPSSGLSHRRTPSATDMPTAPNHAQVKYQPASFNQNRAQQATREKALLTTQLNFPSSK